MKRSPLPSEAPGVNVAAARRAAVLIVDDDVGLASLVGRILSIEHDVVVTTRGIDALELVRAGRSFDLVLCDLMMPEMSGMELYAAVKGASPELAARMVFLTGDALAPQTRTFLAQVPNARALKPVQDIRALVQSQLAARS